MELERNKTALEFEAMMRRHLRNGGAPVVACLGFDADAASSYLEDVLTSAARARFESHLAGCPACRRHTIELSRLSQIALATEKAPSHISVGVAAHHTHHTHHIDNNLWLRWKSAVAERLNGFADISWNWRLAGTALAGCAVLILLTVARPWQQSSPVSMPTSMPTSMSVTRESVSNAISPTPQPAADDEPLSEINPDRQQVARSKVEQNVPAPKLQVTPAPDARGEEQMIALGQTDSLRRQISNEVKPESSRSDYSLTMLDSARPPASASSNFPLPVIPNQSASRERQVAFKPVTDVSARPPQKAPIEPDFAPLPDDNPMRREKRSDKKTSDNKTSAAPRQLGMYDRVLSFMPSRKAESEEKNRVAVKDDETVSPLIRKLRDKTFRFERGIWIDQAYKPEIMAWRVTRLTRGSQDYDRLLAEEPLLKEFLNLGRVIVVWQDKIYRVTSSK